MAAPRWVGRTFVSVRPSDAPSLAGTHLAKRVAGGGNRYCARERSTAREHILRPTKIWQHAARERSTAPEQILRPNKYCARQRYGNTAPENDRTTRRPAPVVCWPPIPGDGAAGRPCARRPRARECLRRAAHGPAERGRPGGESETSRRRQGANEAHGTRRRRGSHAVATRC